MARSFFLALLSAVVAVLAWPPPARAGDPPSPTASTISDEARKNAKAAFAEGERAFAAGDATAALAQFDRAFELAPHDAVRFNIAVCLEALGRYAEALSQYRLAAESKVLSASERERATRAAEAARASVGTLHVEGYTGVEVVVDGRPRCVAPCRVELDPGSHRVEISTQPTERSGTFQIDPGKEVVLAALSDEGPLIPRREAPRAPAKKSADEVRTFAPGPLLWTGVAVSAVGVAGIVGFGVWATGLHDDYLREPTEDRLDRGTLARDLTNASIGVAVLGGLLAAIDLVFLAPHSTARTKPRTAGLRFDF